MARVRQKIGHCFRRLLSIAMWKGFSVGLCVACLGVLAAAQDARDLTEKTLEELMNVKVTSVSKKEEKLSQTAAAISVITQEEIRRSGFNSIPELLRMVPGVDVARIDGTKWAVSIRGFNGRFANKLLVLVDGRSVYSHETNGVYWEALDIPLENIERIEVIRGPGGTLWGSNAVNGVINIITKHARDTQGGLVTAGGGTEYRGAGSVQYGGKLADQAYYRAYGKWFNTSGLVSSSGQDARDGENSVQGGMRLDWQPSARDSLTLSGDIYNIFLRETPTQISLLAPLAPPALSRDEFTGGNVMGRWTRTLGEGSDLALQFYYDRAVRNVRALGERIDTFSIDFQHHFALGKRQDIVWGLGSQLVNFTTNSDVGNPESYNPKSERFQIFSGFIQDEFTLVKDRLRLAAGLKLEHSEVAGFQFQPSVRMLWTPSATQTLWAAVSRAVRTPSEGEESVRSNYAAMPGPGGIPLVVSYFGSEAFKPEILRAYEFGYRVQANSRISLDLSAFYNSYRNLEGADVGSPFFESSPEPHIVIPIGLANVFRGETRGLEAAVNLRVTHNWKVSGGYSFLRVALTPDAAHPNSTGPGNNSPQNQFQVRSYFDLTNRFELDCAVYYVSKLSDSTLQAQNVPAYARLDLRLGWRPAESIELSIGAQNLADGHHPEYRGADALSITSEMKRSVYAKLTWRFQ